METVARVRWRVVGESKMQCSGCEHTVEFVLRELEGVRSVDADHETQSVAVDVATDVTDVQEIREELTALGYRTELIAREAQ